MKLIELMARAYCREEGIDPDMISSGCGRWITEGRKYALWEAQAEQMQAVIRAMQEAGYVIVSPDDDRVEWYKAMLAAAPDPLTKDD